MLFTALDIVVIRSAYGSQLFPGSFLELKQRSTLLDLIGWEAEYLVFLYGTAGQIQLYRTVLDLQSLSRGLTITNFYTGVGKKLYD